MDVSPVADPLARRGLPSGTVTFLFSDIEGSTQRWERDRAAMQSAVRRHDALMHAAMERHGGFVFKTVGDAFCVAFHTVPDAVDAALDAQRSLGSENWDAVDGLRARIAVHTGLADERDGDYFGPTVNRVARLLAIGHGGQTLVSGISADLGQGLLPALTSLHDLGPHRLKDLAFPEQVYQLNADGLPADFAPLRSLDTFAHNLPQQLTTFIGRDEELAEIKRTLETARLLTLVGTGGVGKTRTALQSAADLLDRFPGGVWLVELAPLRDAASIEAVLSSTLGISSTAGRTSRQAIVSALRGKRTLLIFDNCEHVVRDVAPLIEALLIESPGLRVLASSREALAIHGETVYRIPSLAVPPANASLTAEEARGYGAVSLFEELARAHQHDFALSDDNATVVGELCRRLDGIALAIELATPRLKFLSPRSLLDRLDERFRLLTGGSRTALPRQQTMRALIDWSYDLLTEPERKVFRRVAVFVGGWTLEGAAAVCADDELAEWDIVDLLGSLVDKSLVAVEIGVEDQRYRMLESTRQYARERLEQSAELQIIARGHAEHVAARATSFYERYWSSAIQAALRSFAPELDNVRASLTWTLVERHDSELGAKIGAASAPLFFDLGLTVEGVRWLSAAEERAHDRAENVRARVAVSLAWLHDSESEGLQYAQAAVEASRRARIPELAMALHLISLRLWRAGRLPEATDAADEAVAVARAGNDRVRLINSLRAQGIVGFDAAAPERVPARIECFEEAMRLCRAIGDERRLAGVLSWLAETRFAVNQPSAAIEHAEEALAIHSRHGIAPLRSTVASNLAAYLLELGRVDEGITRARESLSMARALNVAEIFYALQRLALGAARRGCTADAARLLGFVDAQVASRALALDYTEVLTRRRIVEELDRAFGDSGYGELLAEGAEMSEDDAIAEALAATT